MQCERSDFHGKSKFDVPLHSSIYCMFPINFLLEIGIIFRLHSKTAGKASDQQTTVIFCEIFSLYILIIFFHIFCSYLIFIRVYLRILFLILS